MTDERRELFEAFRGVLRDYTYQPFGQSEAREACERLTNAALARAEAGVSVEALRQAFLDIEYPEVFADGESRRLSAALAARSAGSGSRVEAGHCCEHAAGAHAPGMNPCLIDGCRCSRPTPPPAPDGPRCGECPHAAHTGDICDTDRPGFVTGCPCRTATPPTPAPAVDGTRCAECGGVKDDVFHVPCLVGGPFHYVKTCHPFTPPTPAPDDRLRALEAALRDWVEEVGLHDACDPDEFCSLLGDLRKKEPAARALLGSDGEGSRS